MPSLLELQTRVMETLLDAPQAAVPARLAVYRHTIRSNFCAALASTYPAVARLLGAEAFRRLTEEFGRHRPSRSGDLNHAGEGFSDYLAERHAHDGLGYLADVARLEGLIEEALLAADHPRLDLTKLSAVAAADYDDLRWVLHPALRLFESTYPARRIWELNVADSPAAGSPVAGTIDPGTGPDRLAVLRQGSRLRLHRLSRGEFYFLNALAQGAAFSDAVTTAARPRGPAEAAACTNFGPDDFDATAALRRFVGIEAIVDFR